MYHLLQLLEPVNELMADIFDNFTSFVINNALDLFMHLQIKFNNILTLLELINGNNKTLDNNHLDLYIINYFNILWNAFSHALDIPPLQLPSTYHQFSSK